jgi:ABC-type polysaccharide/polyol phosphate export permease
VESPIHVTTRGSGAPGDFWRELAESFRHPDFWAMSSWLDIIVRARKSRMGLIWLLAQSIVYVFGLGTFFASMRPAGSGTTMGEHFAHLALGMMVFRTLMSAITGSSSIFVGSQAFIMDGHVRLTDYLLQTLAKAFFDMCMYLPVVAVTLWMAGGVAPRGLLTAVPVLTLIYLNALWIAALFGVIGARLPDLGQLMATVSMFAFILTPIIWYPSMMPEGSLRGDVMRLNPLYHFVEVFRAPILGDAVEPSSLWYIAIFTVLGLAVSTLVYRRYARYVPLWI